VEIKVGSPGSRGPGGCRFLGGCRGRGRCWSSPLDPAPRLSAGGDVDRRRDRARVRRRNSDPRS